MVYLDTDKREHNIDTDIPGNSQVAMKTKAQYTIGAKITGGGSQKTRCTQISTTRGISKNEVKRHLKSPGSPIDSYPQRSLALAATIGSVSESLAGSSRRSNGGQELRTAHRSGRNCTWETSRSTTSTTRSRSPQTRPNTTNKTKKKKAHKNCWYKDFIQLYALISTLPTTQ